MGLQQPMNPATFGIRHLLVLIFLVAFATVSLVFATQLWASVWFSTSATLVLLATSLAILSSRKAFCVGFAVFGCGYWLALYFSGLSADHTPPSRRLESPMITTQFLSWSYDNVLPTIHDEPKPLFDGNGAPMNKTRYPTFSSFVRVGHSLFSLAFAILGGVVTRWFVASESRGDN